MCKEFRQDWFVWNDNWPFASSYIMMTSTYVTEPTVDKFVVSFKIQKLFQSVASPYWQSTLWKHFVLTLLPLSQTFHKFVPDHLVSFHAIQEDIIFFTSTHPLPSHPQQKLIKVWRTGWLCTQIFTTVLLVLYLGLELHYQLSSTDYAVAPK